MDKNHIDFNNDLAMEARKKIEQLEWALTRIKKIEGKQQKEIKDILKRLRDNKKPRTRDGSGALMNELIFFTESFYYHAFRLINIINILPGLETYKAQKVNNVRNMLLEHPEKPESQVFLPSFGSGGPNGPVVKGPRYNHQTEIFPDEGLYINVKELIDELTELLKKFLVRKDITT